MSPVFKVWKELDKPRRLVRPKNTSIRTLFQERAKSAIDWRKTDYFCKHTSARNLLGSTYFKEAKASNQRKFQWLIKVGKAKQKHFASNSNISRTRQINTFMSGMGLTSSSGGTVQSCASYRCFGVWGSRARRGRCVCWIRRQGELFVVQGHPQLKNFKVSFNLYIKNVRGQRLSSANWICE